VAEAFLPGQRWISEGEPGLGLGSVRAVGPRTVTMFFPATGESREYAREHAPLSRVRFHAGESLATLTGQCLVVEKVEQRDGLLHYTGAGAEVCETELSPTLQFSLPRQRIRAGQFDPPETFQLRASALHRQHLLRRSPVRGFLGGRIDLIPHQLAIASKVAARLSPRVLLADEVGLGKTIEAGLILHRLLLTGRARRALVVVPDSLQHQWFLELMRRFNLWFHLYDEERCKALEADDPGCNPFLDDQLVLCSQALLRGPRLEQALEAGWDLLVVDEAHHLGWTEAGASPEYAAVERLAAAIPALLLLTATPEQLGIAGHFARLRLLDPDRFSDLQTYRKQAEGFRATARKAERLLSPEPLTDAEREALGGLPGEDSETMLSRLLDQHGTGRVMFRTTRAQVPGFPRRAPRMAPLAGPLKGALREFEADLEETPERHAWAFKDDPRLPWLAQLLHDTGEDKLLLLCRTRGKAEAIEAALRHHLKVKAAQFHEGLTLVQRDRAAAWFAEPGGARILICSELGSEGRNFQFAHHLVLFDLPLDPGVLEQRIGRLDRIGQTEEIQVHMPYLAGGPQEVLARWYHEGLDAFARNLPGGRELLERFRDRILELARKPGPGLEALLADSRAACAELAERLEQGRDRLLELNSRAAGATALLEEIGAQDQDRALDTFLLGCLDHFFVQAEEVAPRTYQLGSVGVLADTFPGLPSEGLTVTCDRQRALVREDLQFLTWDHPIVTGALDLVLSSPRGNCAFSRWPDPKGTGLYLEAIYLLECLAPPHLHADRFLPPTPLRVVVDHTGRDLTKALGSQALAKVLVSGGQPQPAWLERPLPRMLKEADALAGAQAPALVARARQAMQAQVTRELNRLLELRALGAAVREAEIQALGAQRAELDRHLAGARVRLDAVRLIHRGE
jgi:ATP-dependent helicase HepA